MVIESYLRKIPGSLRSCGLVVVDDGEEWEIREILQVSHI